MMLRLEHLQQADDGFNTIIEIYTDAFPREERREVSHIKELLANEPSYHLTAIYQTDDPADQIIGLLSYWELGEAVFIEHFAIDSRRRGNGVGSEALQMIVNHLENRPIVLEVERPETAIARRRIEFYRRQQFVLWDLPYRQPPYRNGDDWLPMCLMTNGFAPTQALIRRLHQTVYHH
ncbi:MAG: GNAT family N-acetyltransferase [Porphyromonas sp.]|nr:GNAT family N-acetyltransferase [Porphyromonas sp.]